MIDHTDRKGQIMTVSLLKHIDGFAGTRTDQIMLDTMDGTFSRGVGHDILFMISPHSALAHGNPETTPLVLTYDGKVMLTDDREVCPRGHGRQRVIAEHTTRRFCAGEVDILDLACGHQIIIDSSYLEA